MGGISGAIFSERKKPVITFWGIDRYGSRPCAIRLFYHLWKAGGFVFVTPAPGPAPATAMTLLASGLIASRRRRS